MSKPRRTVRLPVVIDADHAADQRLGGTTTKNRTAFPHPGCSKEIVRDADVPVEAEIDLEIAELLTAITASARLELYGALLVLLCWHDAHDRYVRYRAARVLAGTFEPRDDVPARRSDCPPHRGDVGCDRPRCRHHLWVSEDPPGRPGLEHCPRDGSGLTVAVKGDLGAKRPPQLEPRWLEPGRVAPSCALDVVEQFGPIGETETLAAMLHRHRTLILRLIKRAAKSLKSRGVSADDLVRLLEREPQNSNLAEIITTGISVRRR